MNKYTDSAYGGLSGVPSDFNKHASLRFGKPRLAMDYARTSVKAGNAPKKRRQHIANLALRREMNQQASLKPGKEPRPWPGMSA